MMQHAMKSGGKKDTGDDQEYDAGIEGINPRKNLASVGMKLIDQPHATQEHGSIQEGVHPEHALD
jgi:hypothetical protein